MLQTKEPQLEPAIIVIFGLTGDLAQRKLLPALYYLVKQKLLHEHTVILGISRREVTTEEILNGLDAMLEEQGDRCEPEVLNKLRAIIFMRQMDLVGGEDYDHLRDHLNLIEDEHGVHMNRLYYLSIPPQMFGPIVRQLGEHGLNGSCQHGAAVSRLLVEKPFGYDLKSARELIDDTAKYFGEEQIFRIDHYVAKETVQNILTFRFNNPVFNSIWDAGHISHIQITATETLDIEGRVTFYEETGALRDIIQSHLMQLLAILTMERPEAMTADGVHAAKLKLLQAIPSVPADRIWQQTVRGQYEAYRQEVNNPGSRTETYAALRLAINNSRWQDVPVLLRSGKDLAKKVTELCVVFKALNGETAPNVLRFSIQPEGIELNLQAKKPGFDYETQTVAMDFNYEQVFEDHGHPDAYERVLVDAVRGDHTLFATSETVLEAWRIIEPVIAAWAATDEHLETYHKGSWGPGSATDLAEQTGFKWLDQASGN